MGGSFQGSSGKAVGPLTSNPSPASLMHPLNQYLCMFIYVQDSLRCWIYHGEQEKGALASKPLLFIYLFIGHAMWDFISPTRGPTQAPCIESIES